MTSLPSLHCTEVSRHKQNLPLEEILQRPVVALHPKLASQLQVRPLNKKMI